MEQGVVSLGYILFEVFVAILVLVALDIAPMGFYVGDMIDICSGTLAYSGVLRVARVDVINGI